MAYVLDCSAILAILLGAEGAERMVALLHTAARGAPALVPFTAMEELRLYLLRRLPQQVEPVLSLVESWPIEIVESYPQWRHEAVRLQASHNLPAPMAWAASLALLHDAQLVHRDPAFEAVPGLQSLKIP